MQVTWACAGGVAEVAIIPYCNPRYRRITPIPSVHRQSVHALTIAPLLASGYVVAVLTSPDVRDPDIISATTPVTLHKIILSLTYHHSTNFSQLVFHSTFYKMPIRSTLENNTKFLLLMLKSMNVSVNLDGKEDVRAG